MMKDIMKLQNGSDIRGIACEGVEGENVNLTEEAGNLIGGGFKVLSTQIVRAKANNNMDIASVQVIILLLIA